MARDAQQRDSELDRPDEAVAEKRQTRRRLVKAGAMLVPTLVTLRARSALASHSPGHKDKTDPATTYNG